MTGRFKQLSPLRQSKPAPRRQFDPGQVPNRRDARGTLRSAEFERATGPLGGCAVAKADMKEATN
jgi:hypothetical protein